MRWRDDYEPGFYSGQPTQEYKPCAKCRTRFKFAGDSDLCARCAGRPLTALSASMREAQQRREAERNEPARVVAMRRQR